ncbi:MAG: Pr6Pr family membrane protein [Candidatus Sulfotelmatobacter sp.]
MLRGAELGWYLYPFLDANALGYSRVSINAVMLLVGFLLMGLLVVGIGCWMGRTTTDSGSYSH